MKKNNRVGEISYNKYGTQMKIIEYENNSHVLIEFQDENKFKKIVGYHGFKSGNVRNPYDKTVYGVGFLGEGEYKCGGKNSKVYNVWCNMLTRCYNEDLRKKGKHRTYEDAIVCEEWHNFQTFAKWWSEQLEQFKHLDEKDFDLDKDILIKNNKIYCPQNCIPAPQRINSLFTKCNSRRGMYPIGVRKTEHNTFVARCDVIPNDKYLKKQVYLGTYKNPEEAFFAYKQFKENYIKEVAEEYKNRIPKKLYDAMYNYKVEITD